MLFSKYKQNDARHSKFQSFPVTEDTPMSRPLERYLKNAAYLIAEAETASL